MKKFFFLYVAITFMASFIIGCGDNSSSEGDDLKLSGTLSPRVSSTKRTVAKDTVSPDNYKLYCVTFEEKPSAAAGDADSDGNFSLTLEGAKNKPFGCFVQDQLNVIIATIVFQDKTQTGLGNDSQRSGQISLSGNSNLGTIDIDLDTGIATVDVENIKTVKDNSAIAEFWDFSGSWIMSAADTKPEGYDTFTACVDTNNDGKIDNGDDNQGPCDGMTIWMKRVKAYKWISGAADTSQPVFGIMVWPYKEAFEACGSKLGFDISDAREHAGIDFETAMSENTGITAGTYDWSTDATLCPSYESSVAGTGIPGDGWACSNATTGSDGYYAYNPNTQDYVQIYSGSGVPCSTPDMNMTTLDEDWKRIAVMQCYVHYFYDKVENKLACTRRVETNWSASSPGEFLSGFDGPSKARNQYVFEQFIYTGKESGSFSQYNEYVKGYWNSTTDEYVHCRVAEYFKMNTARISETVFLGDMETVNKLVGDSDASCASKVDRLGTQRYMIKFTKQ